MLERLTARNNRSLVDIAIGLPPQCLLAGPNGAGKTSVCKILMGIQDVVWRGHTSLRQKLALLLLITPALWMPGCGSGSGNTTVYVGVRPADLATGEDGRSIRAWIQSWTPETDVARQLSSRFATDLTLMSWPDRRPIEARTALVADETVWGSAVTLAPITPLQPGWYAVQLDVTESQSFVMALAGGPASTLREDGQPIIAVDRFFVGSLPLLALEGYYSPGDDAVMVTLHTSEPVMLGAGLTLDAIVHVEATGAGTCAYHDINGVDAELRGGQVIFLCRGGAQDTVMTLSWLPGLFSLSGVPLRDQQGRDSGTLTWTAVWAPQTLSDSFVASSNASAR